MKIIKSIAMLILAYVLIFPTQLSAEITPSQLEIIRIAFMNGYVNAVKGDIETIMLLKQDEQKLKEFSSAAVDGYMEKVSMLNLKDNKGNPFKKPEAAVSHSIAF